MAGTWMDFLRGGLPQVLDFGGAQTSTNSSNVPAQSTPVANSTPSVSQPQVHPSTAGLLTHQDMILLGVAGALVVVLVMMRH